MTNEKPIYEGKAKKVFAADRPDEVLIYYKDDATAFNGAKKGSIDSKGVLNNAIASMFFELLESRGVATHFLKKIDERTMLARRLEIVPLEVVVRNVAAGSLAQRLGWAEGRKLPRPVAELYYKDDALGDPLINRHHVAVLEAATEAEVDFLETTGFRINAILSEHLKARNLILVDFKLEFGRFDGSLLLGDEISPDTCRFWDAETGKKLDKDRFRRDLGEVEAAYQEIFNRLQ